MPSNQTSYKAECQAGEWELSSLLPGVPHVHLPVGICSTCGYSWVSGIRSISLRLKEVEREGGREQFVDENLRHLLELSHVCSDSLSASMKSDGLKVGRHQKRKAQIIL